MATIATPFSIQQERWSDVWVAATAAVKSRKKQQVDFNIQHRVEDLLQEYGPESDTSLTLRVYGTMLKGFCVLNNERARLLYTDAERVVVMFAQRSFLEDCGLKPAAKRQRTDALALDLGLSKVPESDIFNWSQTEDSALLQLHSIVPVDLPEAQALPQLSLLEDARLLDESFPPIDMQTVVPLDAAAEAVRMAEAAEAAAAAVAQDLVPAGSAPLAFPAVSEVAKVQNLPGASEQAAPSFADLIAANGDPIDMMELAPGSAIQPEIQRRGPRGPHQLPGAGHVFGFDEVTELVAQEWDAWQLSTRGIGGRALEPAEHMADVLMETEEPDRLGMLHVVLDPTSESAAIQRLVSRSFPQASIEGWVRTNESQPFPLQDGSMPEVQALLAGDGGQEEANVSEWPMEETQCPSLGDTVDPFRPYMPKAPLLSMHGADMELAGALGAQGGHMDEGPGDEVEEVEAKYDEQTAQVAGILSRYMERTAGESRKVTLDDIIPPSSTDKDIAARTFLAVLTLATAGDLCVEQMQPYGAVAISMK